MAATTSTLRLVSGTLLGALSQACVAGSAPASCPATLEPIRTVPPKLPARTEVIYEGKAEFAITINRNGRVSDAVLVSNHVRNHGSEADSLDGGSLLAAVSQWRYVPRQNACRKQVTIEIH